MGDEDIRQDRIDPARAAGLLALLDRDGVFDIGAALPPLAHLLYFWDVTRQSRLGDDGHAAHALARADADLPLRMWAGGRVSFHAPFRAGIGAERSSRVTGSRRKTGRSGELTFVTLRHMIRQAGRPVVTEEQDLVYRADADLASPYPRVTTAALDSAPIRFDAVALFRYSALTFNAHRIHYDLPYCKVHGYPGLVVHGPLLATALAWFCADRIGHLQSFAFRATAPLFGGEPARLCRDGGLAWVEGPDGRLCMTAEAS